MAGVFLMPRVSNQFVKDAVRVADMANVARSYLVVAANMPGLEPDAIKAARTALDAIVTEISRVSKGADR